MSYVWVLFLVLFVPWIAALIDGTRRPSQGWKAADLDKTTWIVLLITSGFVGAIGYWGFIRPRLTKG